MPQPNFCTSGFPCKTCPGPSQTVKNLCTGSRDTECKCAKDYYLVNHEADVCHPLPRCNKGFEPRPGAGTEDGAEKICQNCGDGFYQPKDNSTDLCRKFTNCITTPGTDVSDNICKGDPQSSGLPATSPNENAASVLLTKASIGPNSPTPEGTKGSPDQTGPTSPTLEGTTDSPNQTGPTSPTLEGTTDSPNQTA
ncbi:tumor necrosis factor receptor superfamily member 1B-like [Asterias rubens]|uniref:tumor necrosis factor receptor superfamily member 1B-like n=1 Tax=Asterias rubens TaxID=7604 RepID=UPI0014552643|nr:tumor necrosis factor receptor superfamily member 1B-like [Asterias rubens]